MDKCTETRNPKKFKVSGQEKRLKEKKGDAWYRIARTYCTSVGKGQKLAHKEFIRSR